MRIPLRTLACLLALGSVTPFLTTGCSSTGTRRSTGEFVDDASISTRIKGAFVQDSVVSALDVGVDTYRGVVQLNGFVETPEQKARAEQIARNVPGVVDVQNRIAVKGEPPR